MPDLKNIVGNKNGHSLQRLVYRVGLMNLASSLRGCEGAVVLMYHSAAEEAQSKWIDPRDHVPADVFTQQMEFLSRERRVVSLVELVSCLKQGQTPEKGTVVITFDDGYLDNLTVAAPILENYGLTATLFLPTGYIDRGENQWVDQAYAAFKARTRNKLKWISDSPQVYDLKQPVQHKAAYRAVCSTLLVAAREKRHSLLANLYDQLAPARHPPRLTMNWEEVQTLVSRHRCFEIGGHSLEHTDLTRVSEADAIKELTGCAERIKEMLGRPPRYFSFCYSRTSKPLQRLVAEAGFEAACGRCGYDIAINSKKDLFDLPRIEAPPTMDNFDLITCAANTGVWRRLGR
ncbi:polysaccharide deacetylase family protein [Desulfurivibrio sp. D14AmB]|uniref:polysaccharide deacetylase family protein n=1 Tax=Desulfurivibrio sp. D14AmB TaxID=3374370 RepID=UPI00376F0BA7